MRQSRHNRITRLERALFDRLFKQVLHTLPAAARDLLKTIPVAVDDYASTEIQSEMQVDSDELFGLYTGTPPVERSIEHVGALEDVIHIYRLALLLDASTRTGRINQARLRRQIRTTLLHELGHYHGFDEDELDRLGY
ncbi:MAG: hypothetical protein HW386_2601 [Gammaproteobacteria bacterium]|nr:hypothetical protein [Gammaproteobacteria bacterium]